MNIEADAELGMHIDLVGMPGVFDGDESCKCAQIIEFETSWLIALKQPFKQLSTRLRLILTIARFFDP